MSLARPVNPPTVNPGVQKPTLKTTSQLSSRTLINQVRGITLKGSTGSGIPKVVTDVQASLSNASAGVSSVVNVQFRRDPSDSTFGRVLIFAQGYQNNSTPVQVGSSTDSPATLILDNTGEAVTLIVQAVGNGGAVPLTQCPSVGVQLPKSTGGGFGSQTITSPITKITLAMPAEFGVAGSPLTVSGGFSVSKVNQTANTFWAGPTGGGAAAPTFRAIVAADIPNLDAGKITTGQLALARGGTGADLSGTGGASKVLKQTSVGAAVTVAQLAASDLSNGLTGSGLVVLATGPSVTGLTTDTETLTAAAPTVAAGQVGLGATTATSATAGSNGAVPAQVAGYLIINVGGTNFKVPYFPV